MFAFAQNLANRLARLVDQPHLKERYACRSFRLLKLDRQAGDAELVDLDRETAT